MIVPNIEEGGVLWNKVRDLYGVGPRFYHTFGHALDVLKRVDEFEKAVGFMDYQAARLAALFHDAIYVVGDPNNEEHSLRTLITMVYANHDAIWGTQLSLENHTEIADCLDRASNLIRATSRHTVHQKYFTDWDTVLFLDCDVLGFASDSDTFQQNNSNIDKEFATSPAFDPEKYAQGRLKFLMTMYEKGIFRSPYVKRLYEGRAITNLGGYLVDLGVDAGSL